MRGSSAWPLLAHCHLGLGTLGVRAGRRKPALEHLTAARTLYRDMNMRTWQARVEAVLGERGAAVTGPAGEGRCQ